MDQLKKNFLWNAAGNIVYLICQWLVTVLVPILGGFEDAGVLSVAMSVSATFQTVAMFGIRSYQVSDVEEKYTDSCYVGLRALTCALALILCLGFSLVSGYLGEQLISILLFMLFRLAENYSDVLHGVAQKRDRLDIAGKAFSIKGIGILVCFLAGYVLTQSLNFGLLLMMAFSVASTFLYDLSAVSRLSSFRLIDKLTSCGRLALETLPLFVYQFLYVAISTVPKLILEKQCGGEILGAYSSIFAPAMLLQAATGYLYTPFATQFAEQWREKDGKSFQRLLVKICVAILVIAVLVILLAIFFGEFALVLVFGEQIRAFVYLLNPILIVNFCISFLGLFCMLTVVLRRFRRLLVACASAFLVCVLLSFPLIGNMGANGASYSLIFACLIGTLIMAIGAALDIYRLRRSDPSENKERCK